MAAIHPEAAVELEWGPGAATDPKQPVTKSLFSVFLTDEIAPISLYPETPIAP